MLSVAIFGQQAMFAYYARIPRVIEGRAVSPIHRSRGCQTEAIDRSRAKSQPGVLQRRGVDPI